MCFGGVRGFLDLLVAGEMWAVVVLRVEGEKGVHHITPLTRKDAVHATFKESLVLSLLALYCLDEGLRHVEPDEGQDAVLLILGCLVGVLLVLS